MTNVQLPDLKFCNSVERGEVVVDWVLANIKRGADDKQLGKLFWEIVKREWSGFDRIEHDRYAWAFRRFRMAWTAPPDLDPLPQNLQVWRGQDARDTRLGLSWSLSRQVAEGFALGLRYRNDEPTLLRAEIKRHDIAFWCNDRQENELVLFEFPKSARKISISTSPSKQHLGH